AGASLPTTLASRDVWPGRSPRETSWPARFDRMLSPMAFDWNRPDFGAKAPRGMPASGASERLAPLSGSSVVFGQRARGVRVVDETLRDGLQSASGVNPPVGHKIDLLHAMARVGVDVVSVGLPAAGGKSAEDAFRLCREIVD